MATNEQIRIGVGAGFADDRVAPARDLAERGQLDYLVFECLAERTIARETLTRLSHPDLGYTPNLIDRLAAVLPVCVARGTRIVTNMGAANPRQARLAVRQWCQANQVSLGPIGVVEGDDVLAVLRAHPELRLMECGTPVEALLPDVVAANAYLGAAPLADALGQGAAMVITGRVADPALFVACMMDGLGWRYDDYPLIGAGTFAGHLLECGAQVSGGCFADPGVKEVPDLAHVGMPYVDVHRDGRMELGKVDGTGGRLDAATCTEQALYEIHDPHAYVTADCVLDIAQARFEEIGRDRVAVSGVRARPRTDSYKVSVGYRAGWMGEGEIAYAGPNAFARARLAGEIVKLRLQEAAHVFEDLRVDLIGHTALHGEHGQAQGAYEVRLRVCGRSLHKEAARAVGVEVKTLNLNGPAGSGGSASTLREVIGVKSVLMPRHWVHPHVTMERL
ncbi:acyclic terpene utilization AtuA family protein [Bordetella genomosp. 12]|uniref:acyclic terpene utilization AtuA family protein n=1 Tax=Bordetella genomosp. 12 TaxID=463035 RepID=UPI001FC902F6|nr:acyclic terpene utilization AtuA family protein [Bordetella genomosp. 12]